jgi:hypothetical protein
MSTRVLCGALVLATIGAPICARADDVVVIPPPAECDAEAEGCDCAVDLRPRRPELRQVVFGLSLFAASYTLGTAYAWAVSRASDRVFDALPVVGAIVAAERGNERSVDQAALIFSAAVQLVGILVTATAWHAEDPLEPRLSLGPAAVSHGGGLALSGRF